MRRTGRLQLDVAGQRLIVEPVQHALVFFRSNHLLGGDIDTAAHRHQQEGVQRIGAQVAGQREHVGQLVSIVAGDGGVDLYRYAQLLQVAHTVNRRFEGSRNTAEGVVGSRHRRRRAKSTRA